MEKIAIVGTGIAGMACAHFLHKKFDITVFEQNAYVGGHTNTVVVAEEGKDIPIDTGFMVFNMHTYPNLIRLFGQLGVKWKNTDMSFSVQHRPTGLEYSGSGLDGLFGQRKNIFNVRHIRMLRQIDRFNKESIKILDDPKYLNYSMRDYVKEKGYGDDFLYKYLSPMSSALWSTPTDTTLEYPAVALVRFFKNHGFLGLNTQFQWLTVSGGSAQYRDLIIQPWEDRIRTHDPVVNVERLPDGKVILLTQKGYTDIYDKVIFASHADETLKMLEAPTTLEHDLLKKFQYQKNVATLHTDSSVMPKIKKIWSSWNYVIAADKNKSTPFTVYYMNRLQQVSDKLDYFVNINGAENVNPAKILKTIVYHHPIFTVEAIKAQAELPRLNKTGPVYFCGSYFKYGFHEDALTSAVDLCTSLLGGNVWKEHDAKIRHEESLLS